MMSYVSVTKDDAVQALVAMGHAKEAAALRKWRNCIGNNGGWDGHVRGRYPYIVPVLFPREFEVN